MTEQEEVNLNEAFEVVVATEDVLEIREFLNNLNISDVAALVHEYPDYGPQIIINLSIHRASSTFKILDLPVQKKIIQQLPPAKTAELLNELQADDRTDFLEELPSEVVKELIKLLNPNERKTTLSLLGYPEDSVGRLMTPDYIAVQVDWTVQEVMATQKLHGPFTTEAAAQAAARTAILGNDCKVTEGGVWDPAWSNPQ